MANCVGEKRGTTIIKGSSKPQNEETLEQKVAKCISSKQTFKDGSKILEKLKITDIHVLTTTNVADAYLLPMNYKFEGNAQICIPRGEINVTEIKKIRGYAYVKDGEVVELSQEIQII